jgi:hypothetical protein
VLPYQIRGIQIVALSGALLVGLVGACSDSAARECRVGADCASGLCGSDGQCVPAHVGPAGPDGGPQDDAMSVPDGSVPETSSDAALPGCTPNKDGTITREEVPIAAGLHATYKVGKDEDISTAGTAGAGGKRAWDFSAALASDVSVLIETQPLAGKWYAAKYPGATYASKLSESADLLGVFETSPGALLLRGVVSPAEGSSSTQLTYTPAVSVLSFPLKLDATWTTDATASGTAKGVDLAFVPTKEKYESQVDAAGTLKTPLGTFDVLRVRVLLTRSVTTGVVTNVTKVRTFAFVTECYGTIATVTSSDNENNVEFTHAAEIRRISP